MVISKTAIVLLAAVFLAGAAALTAQAQLGLGLASITGTVHCTTGIPTASTPAFPNAAVQLQCGGSVMSSATTNSNGVFDMALSLLPSIVSTLLSDCKLVVATPLAACGITLPAGGGTLQSALQLLNPGGLVGQILGLINIIPSGFSLVK